MPFISEDLALPGVKLITPKRFSDARGFFSETYNVRDFATIGITANFVQDNHARSAERGTVRGLHFQKPPHAQGKLIRVTQGRVLDVAVDLRKDSSTYGKSIAVELSAENWKQLWVPEGFAHGYCTLVPNTELVYKVSDFYSPASDAGVRWSDPALSIPWPDFAGVCLSSKDEILPNLSEIESPFTLSVGN